MSSLILASEKLRALQNGEIPRMSNPRMAQDYLKVINKKMPHVIIVEVGIYQYFLDTSNKLMVANLKRDLSDSIATAQKELQKFYDGYKQIENL